MPSANSQLTPSQIVQELDKHIVGQKAAKRAVAIALRNRWRRQQVPAPLRQEITPKNILMIGPTGVGKTEIARRLAKLANAPFIKVEATKFTEVGYVGRDVDSIIRDLIESAIKQTREQETQKVKERAQDLAEERILDALLPGARDNNNLDFGFNNSGLSTEEHNQLKQAIATNPTASAVENTTRQKFRKMLREGQLDDKEIEIEVASNTPHMEIFAPPGMEDLTSQIQGMFQSMGNTRKKARKLKIKDALKTILEEESLKLINDEDLKTKAVQSVEQNGIVFLDEIDKITSRSETGSGEVSRQGVQRDLLPLVEGTTVSTKYGMIKTDHILFIASGAFHLAKPSDLIPELQGRFPIRVELDSLSVDDFKQILTNTDACLTRQYEALLATDQIHLAFTEDGITRLAEIAHQVNEKMENIGARRLYTVMEKLLEEVSFNGGNVTEPITLTIDKAYVDQSLQDIAASEDLARYVL